MRTHHAPPLKTTIWRAPPAPRTTATPTMVLRASGERLCVAVGDLQKGARRVNPSHGGQRLRRQVRRSVVATAISPIPCFGRLDGGVVLRWCRKISLLTYLGGWVHMMCILSKLHSHEEATLPSSPPSHRQRRRRARPFYKRSEKDVSVSTATAFPPPTDRTMAYAAPEESRPPARLEGRAFS